MASERQIAANRVNATASTGPRSADGKALVSRNAVTHGLTAYGGFLAGESPEEFIEMRARVLDELERKTPSRASWLTGLSAFSGGCGAFLPSKWRSSPGSRRARGARVPLLSAIPALPETTAISLRLNIKTPGSFWGVRSMSFLQRAWPASSAATRRPCSGSCRRCSLNCGRCRRSRRRLFTAGMACVFRNTRVSRLRSAQIRACI